MGVWSNAVTVTVEEKFEVATNTLKAPAGPIYVGEPATFTGTVTFTRPAPETYTLLIDIEVNGSITQRDVPVETISPGESSKTYSFQLEFGKPGSYTIRTYAKVAPAGTAPPPTPPKIPVYPT